MKITITQEAIVFDGERQIKDAESRGFSCDFLGYLIDALKKSLNKEKAEICNFIFHLEDRQRKLSEHLYIIAEALEN